MSLSIGNILLMETGQRSTRKPSSNSVDAPSCMHVSFDNGALFMLAMHKLARSQKIGAGIVLMAFLDLDHQSPATLRHSCGSDDKSTHNDKHTSENPSLRESSGVQYLTRDRSTDEQTNRDNCGGVSNKSSN